ncbi:Protein-glutamate methylesterase/protein-glutamine glutaminase [Sporomusa rhizae]|uniref:response regulator n=1 Tax=Sporomusa rhizae TaxID=357999 RepID=UPI00352A3FA0
MRFLIVDDDIGFRRTISYIIEKYHLGVVVGNYGDGLEAETGIRKLRPDIVVVDLLLPGQSGIELTKKISSINNKISYIMISACSNKSIITEAMLSGIDYYLQKPINVLDFNSVIKKIAERKKAGPKRTGTLCHKLKTICRL